MAKRDGRKETEDDLKCHPNGITIAIDFLTAWHEIKLDEL